MLFVNDDDAHVLDGGEDRRARADGDARSPLAETVPFVEPLACRKPAVQNGGGSAEPCAQLRKHLRRERDLGYQKDRRLPARQSLGNEGEVDLRLAAPRDSMEKRYGLVRLFYAPDGGILRRCERTRRTLALYAAVRVTQYSALFEGDRALFDERVHGRAEHLAEHRRVRLAVFLQKCDTRRLLRGVFCGGYVRDEARKRAVRLPHSARPHFGGQKEAQNERHGHAVARRDRMRERKALGTQGREILLRAVDLFEFFRRIVARIFHAHDKARRRAFPEGYGDARPRRNGKIAGIVENFIDLAVRNIYDDLANHVLMQKKPLIGAFHAAESAISRARS